MFNWWCDFKKSVPLIFFFIDPIPSFPYSLPPACSTSVPSIPFLLLITLLVLWNNLSQVLWTAFFKTQLQKLLTCQPYLKVSSNDKGPQPSLQLLLILLIPGWKLICPGNASCAWLHLRLFTWVLPGGLWHVCLLAFSSLQVEANTVSLRMLPAWLCSSVL